MHLCERCRTYYILNRLGAGISFFLLFYVNGIREEIVSFCSEIAQLRVLMVFLIASTSTHQRFWNGLFREERQGLCSGRNHQIWFISCIFFLAFFFFPFGLKACCFDYSYISGGLLGKYSIESHFLMVQCVFHMIFYVFFSQIIISRFPAHLTKWSLSKATPCLTHWTIKATEFESEHKETWIFHTVAFFFLSLIKPANASVPEEHDRGRGTARHQPRGWHTLIWAKHDKVEGMWRGSEEIPMLLECNIPLKLLAGGDIASIMTSKAMEEQEV